MRRSCLCLRTGVLLAFGIVGNEPAAAAMPTCLGVPATIIGSSDSDVITGTSFIDVILARGGRRDPQSLEGDDIICAGTGNDVVDTGEGYDRLASSQVTIG